jgi:hypothetical protein
LQQVETIVYYPLDTDATDTTLRIATKRAEVLDIRHIVLPSNSGNTTLKLVEIADLNRTAIVSVTVHAGYFKGDEVAISDTTRELLVSKGVKVLCCSHVLSGVERSISREFHGVSHAEIAAYTLRLFGCEGIKVAVEVAIMAADAGLVPTDREIIALGGSHHGVDTAVVLKAAHQNSFFSLEIREILCKPRQRPDGETSLASVVRDER